MTMATDPGSAQARPADAPRRLPRPGAAGVGGRPASARDWPAYTLFSFNVDSPDQLAASTAALRAGRADVLVAIDEEGGDVTRLAHRTGSPYPGNAALGAVGRRRR